MTNSFHGKAVPGTTLENIRILNNKRNMLQEEVSRVTAQIYNLNAIMRSTNIEITHINKELARLTPAIIKENRDKEKSNILQEC